MIHLSAAFLTIQGQKKNDANCSLRYDLQQEAFDAHSNWPHFIALLESGDGV